MNIQLFLAHADNQQPIADDGIPIEATFDAPALELPVLAATRFTNLAGTPDSLPEQQWALVAPKGEIGDRLLELVAPLKRRREEEQGREALVYRVDPGMDSLAAVNWIQRDYRDAVGRIDADRPRYLALLGGPEVISWDFQQMLAGEAFVGRLPFDEDAGYEAYVEKLVQWSNRVGAPCADVLFHSVLDGTRATQEGHRHLMAPSLQWAQKAHADGSLDATRIFDIPMSAMGSPLDPSTAAQALLDESARASAGMLFTMSHGAGLPQDGWQSAQQQRDLQGAMVLGRKGDLLSANDIKTRPFLPGGVWFMFACYGAGTPARSAFFPWLDKLRSLGILGKTPHHVLDALPQNGAGFVAALPQAALANPDGPVGFIGHVDLAWSWSFLDYDVTPKGLIANGRADRFQSSLQALTHGHRLGVAHHELVKFYRSVNTELTASYESRAQRALAEPGFVEPAINRIRRANLWMQRQDASAYVLLGDPAARLPIALRPGGIELAPSTHILPAEAERRADAVLAILRGTTSMHTVAKQLGVSKDEVERWKEAFIEAGRAALAKG